MHPCSKTPLPFTFSTSSNRSGSCRLQVSDLDQIAPQSILFFLQITILHVGKQEEKKLRPLNKSYKTCVNTQVNSQIGENQE
jgi:hypothetical protein